MKPLLNNWKLHKVIHKDKILNFDILISKNCLKEVDKDYFYLISPLEVCESFILEIRNEELASDLGITEVEREIKNFINQLNKYNELKEIGETLVHKTAERKGKTSKQIFNEMDYKDLSISYD
ncbi:hypothetical protein NBO_1230g0003 [Nosema bombycis CQ1]|uniref:Uncharacterized protein n=1 Tax=Nosema bombycis (strain CQ1 / CVCC 102059) TaxID=578461 RepID=R0MF78_NOSB1|nr:hypothetical protein NBO_1230g0003 [Nosema bombycis CQ1]|eukprot:EOB11383.1 hypothetical protein NBO_1230g0003 [Nosema bombycis CQ1]